MKRELIATARRLASPTRRKPSQSDLRRAISTTDYALFHSLAERCADELAGRSSGRRLSDEWFRIYRALNHGQSETALDELYPQRKQHMRRGMPTGMDPTIENFCEALEEFKQLRHAADYDPRELALDQAVVQGLVDEAQAAIEDLASAPASGRRALAFACVVSLRRG